MAEAQTDDAHAWAVAVTAGLAMTVGYVDRQTLAAIAPTVREALHLSNAQYGWTASGFSFAYMIGAPIAGFLLDRVGVRRGLAIGIALWSLVAGAHALATSFASLLALRIVLGVTEAPGAPGATRTIRNVIGPNWRAFALGFIFTGSSVGALVAAPLAVSLNTHYGWRTAFVVTSTIGAAWLLLWFGVTSGSRMRKDLAVTTEERKMSPFGALANPYVRRLVLVTCMITTVGAFVFTWLPQFMVAKQGVPQKELGKYLWVTPLLLDAGVIGFGVAATRFRRLQRRFHLLVVLAGTCVTALLGLTFVKSPALTVLLAGIAHGGSTAIYLFCMSTMVEHAHRSQAATVGSLATVAQSITYTVVNPLIGAWLDRTHDYRAVVVLPVLCVWIGVAIWTLVGVDEVRSLRSSA